jgi:hypothetical protein
MLFTTTALLGCGRLPEQKIVFVAHTTIKCASSIGGPMIPVDPSQATLDCIQIRESRDQPWGFTSGIQDFTYEPGFSYTLRVNKIYPDPNLMDAFPYLQLLETLEKTPAQ